MAQTTADFIVGRIAEWGVKRIYGYPGDGINGMLIALAKARDTVDFVQVRHEEMAAFMACGHAKFTGEVGVCIATSGPGAIHLLNGLYDAKLDHQPVVAIVGQTARAAMGGHYQQEVDLVSLFKDVAGEYVHMATTPTQVRHLIDRAFRIAKAQRTVTCVILPNDLQELPAEPVPPHMHSTVHSSSSFSVPVVVPMEQDLRRAADILNAGKKVAMLVGAGAKGATEEVLAVADLLGAGIAKALLGKAVVPDDAPGVTGAIGLLGTKPSWDMMKGCDTLLMVGTSFPYPEFLPEEGQARGIQIDIDGRMLAIRYPMEIALCGDARETLRLLKPYLEKKTDRSWRDGLVKSMAEWRATLAGRAKEPAKPLNPQLVFHELSPRLPSGAIITSDSGSSANWFARHLDMRPGMMASLSGNLATMGPGVPYAIAAKMEHSGKPVIALVGDGAMQMNGMNELLTVAKYWHRWKTPTFVVLVLNNRDLNQVTWELRVEAGNPKIPATQEIPDFPFASYAESIGLQGIRVDSPDRVAWAWETALSADKPTLIEAVVDPEVPPLPPHITYDQAKKFASAVWKNDPNMGHMIGQVFRDWYGGKRGA
ncbi:thiamine pyrophosphate-requiring protein [Vulgatibacter incomptus]|uniref:Pyruvate oxidase n=1 Tax=Vulgatibacter incomptus TaxID=1391653 RepID=A0A0K1P9Z5_9BACT|nr:thiamine pyrophosphate-requiring protein [Vulgatibacter incomptus]AKU90236.1 Pyruvate oxidase [Vulgatibacter incomptus]